MITITIKHGLQSTQKNYITPPTIGEIKADMGLRAELNYGDNVKALVGDVEQADFVPITGGVVELETAANKKAI